MKLRGDLGRFLLPSILIIGALHFLVISDLSADAKKVLRARKDAYVVELREQTVFSSAQIASTKASNWKNFLVEALGAGPSARLAKFRKESRVSAAFSTNSQYNEDEFVDVDPNDKTCEELIKSGIALTCSPDYEVHALRSSNDDIPWGLDSISVLRAWDKTTGSKDVIVAVLDTGVDYNHPDLAGNIWKNSGEIAGNGLDDDHNGVVDDVVGYNALNDSGDPMDDNGHGTHVAGTIGAVGNNGIGVAGINWNVQILPLKFLGATGSGSLSTAIKAIDYLLKLKARGVNVVTVNNSWGGGGFSDALYQAFQRAADAGIIMAVAAGNESNDNDAEATYPASFDLENVISVAAVDRDNNLASFSNFGLSSVDIAAPGVSILSLAPGGGYRSLSGTSMATPHVAGALALLYASEPNLGIKGLIQRLYDSGDSYASLNGITRTGRALNVARAVFNETAPVPTHAIPEPCTYQPQEVAFSPDHSPDYAPIALRGDELSFKNLGFNFKFFGRSVNRVVLSLNGLLYAGSKSEEMDYKNGSRALPNSIAALHTDLNGASDPFGVRYRLNADKSKLTVHWRMRHFLSPDAGEIKVWAELQNTGEIKTCMSIDPSIASRVLSHATIGLSPSNPSNAVTFASNNPSIQADSCIEYVPQCSTQNPVGGNNPVHISKVQIKNYSNTKTLRPGQKLSIRAIGSGDGISILTAALNGRQCPTTKAIKVKNGRSRVQAAIPDSLAKRSLTRLTVRVDGVRASRYVYGKYSQRSSSRPNKSKISQASFRRYCKSLIESVR